MFRRILTPTNGSEPARQAIDKDIAPAASIGRAVTVVTVTELFHILSTHAMPMESSHASYDTDVRACANDVLAAARDKAAAAGVSVETHHEWHDSPCQAIIHTALDKGCNLLAMASHGRRSMAAGVMGSQAAKLLTHSKIPVLICR